MCKFKLTFAITLLLWTTSCNAHSEVNKYGVFVKALELLEIKTHSISQTCFRTFKIHQCISEYDMNAQANVLVDICLKYKDAERIDDISSLSTFIEQTSGRNSMTNALLLTKCMKLIADRMTTNIQKAFMDIIIELLTSTFFESIPLLTYVSPKIYGNLETTYRDRGLFICQPFRDDALGFAFYENENFTDGFSIKKIYRNQSLSTVNLTNLAMAGYIPADFLNDLTADLSMVEKQDVNIVVLYLRNTWEFMYVVDVPSYKISDVKEFIGISIPGMCKKNYRPLLHAFLKPIPDKTAIGKWKEFDSDYFDFPNYSGYKCILNEILFYGQHSSGKYFESILDKYHIARNNISKNKSWLTPRNKNIFAPHFCMDKYLNIPKLDYFDVSYEKSKSFNCFENHLTSNLTEYIYQLHVDCEQFNENCNSNISINDPRMTIVDLIIHYKVIFIENRYRGVTESKWAIELLEKGLELMMRNHPGRVIYLLKFIDLFHDRLAKQEIYESSKFIYLNIFEDITSGFVLYTNDSDPFANPSVQLLTDANFSVSYASDDNVEVLVYMPERMKLPLSGLKVHFFVFHGHDIWQDVDSFCKSEIIGIKYFCTGCVEENLFRIYMKVTNQQKMWYTQGYWFEVGIRNGIPSLMCVSEPYDNVCDSGSKLNILQSNEESFSGTNITMKSYTNIDILSQLAVVAVFASSIFLKNWRIKRFNTIQLAIALAVELVFFLLDTGKFTHIAHLIFYYAILTQFTWMLIIGYVSYLKFIRVFGDYKLSMLKSMLFAWLTPAIVILVSIFVHLDCLKCNLCYKNHSIFAYFVIIPILLIIICNLAIYIAILVTIIRSRFQVSPETKKARLRAAVMFPFLFGISWIFVFAILAPWSTVSLIGSYFFHVIAPSQGFLLFTFAIALDMDSKIAWSNYIHHLAPNLKPPVHTKTIILLILLLLVIVVWVNSSA